MIYQKINNPGLGLCHVLKENSYGYLIYSEENLEHFIVVSNIEDNLFYCSKYFKGLNEAIKYFNNLGDDE